MEKKQDQLEEWQPVVERQAASGKTIAAFCEENRMTRRKFIYWRGKLRLRQTAQPEPPLELLPVVTGEHSAPETAASASSSGADSGVAIQAGRLRILLAEDFNGATLKRVLEIAGGFPC